MAYLSPYLAPELEMLRQKKNPYETQGFKAFWGIASSSGGVVHKNLNLACLPISPYPHSDDRTAQSHSSQDLTSGMPQIFLGPCERFRGFPSAASLYHSFSSDQRENARARCPYPACLRTGGLPSLQPGADRNAMRRRMPMRCANCISSMWTLHCTNRFKRPIFTSWNSKQRTPPPSAALIGLAALLLPVANRLCDARRSSPGGRSLPLPHCTLQVIHLPTILAHVHFPAP